MKIIMIYLLFIAMINCQDEYEDCLNKIAVPRAQEVVYNFYAGQSSENNDIVYDLCKEQFICVYSKIISSIEYVKDYMYKDIYAKIFETSRKEELTMILNHYWNMRDEKKTEELCYSLLGKNFDCKGVLNSFTDCYNRKFT